MCKFYYRKEMMRNSLILLMTFISCLAYSIGLEFPYQNNSLLTLDVSQNLKNFTIPCSDDNEVEWIIDSTFKAKNSIQVESPNKKNVVIQDVDEYDSGVYKCVSKKNPNVFMKVVVRVWDG